MKQIQQLKFGLSIVQICDILLCMCKGILRQALQLDMHTSFLVANAVIDIVWIMFCGRFRDKRNVDSDCRFIQARKAFRDFLKIRKKLLINKSISLHSAWPISTGLVNSLGLSWLLFQSIYSCFFSVSWLKVGMLHACTK